MIYVIIFGICHLISFASVFLWAKKQNNLYAKRLRDIGASDVKIQSFHKRALNLPLLIQPTLFFGTIGGAITSFAYWVAV